MKTEVINGTEWITDDLGGVHSEGTGWNPNGVWCGECCNISCEGCTERNKRK